MNNTEDSDTGRFWVKFFKQKTKQNQNPAGAKISWPAWGWWFRARGRQVWLEHGDYAWKEVSSISSCPLGT